MASYFNDFFTTIAEKLASKLPTPSKQFDTDPTVFKEYYLEIAPPKFKLETVSEDFVLKELKILILTKVLVSMIFLSKF